MTSKEYRIIAGTGGCCVDILLLVNMDSICMYDWFMKCVSYVLVEWLAISLSVIIH